MASTNNKCVENLPLSEPMRTFLVPPLPPPLAQRLVFFSSLTSGWSLDSVLRPKSTV